MNELKGKINPKALKIARKRRNMTQQQLADAVREKAKGCTKDTVSRWERGKTRSVRKYLRKPLCEVLRVEWKQLTEPPEKLEGRTHNAKVKVSIGKHLQTSLQLVAERFDVRWQDVLELAPLLFFIVAERSLLERRRRLDEIHALIDETQEKILPYSAHLGPIISAHNNSGMEQLYEEEESLSKRDVFGRTISYEYGRGNDEGPFVHYIRDLVNDLPKGAVNNLFSFDGDAIEMYEIADDTLRECTGIFGDDKDDKCLLQYIRSGAIDFVECQRIKRNTDDAGYRQWLSGELVRATEEERRRIKKLF